MKRHRLLITSFALLLMLSFSVEAQTQKKPLKKTVQKTQPKKTTPTKKPIVKTTPAVARTVAEDEKRVRDMVSFLQFMLNTLGSSATSTRDKEVMVKESYSKIFRDGKVQIEDDLDDERVVVTNKDIVPYLKDVDFFFKDVKFEFSIEDIKSSTLKSGEQFYKVSTRRVITGTTTEDKKITNTIPRYIEINYHPETQDLKIVSIYTNEFNEKEALTNWWNELSQEWQSILRKKLPIGNKSDSLSISEIKSITATEEINLNNNVFIQDIEPLHRLINLKSLTLSNTNVKDLTPIRNLAELTTLNVSHTKITDLSSLKYANKLVSLDISHTLVSDISVIEKMSSLQNLNASVTPATDFSYIAMLPDLREVKLSYTTLSTLTPFENLVNVTTLDISGTAVQDLSPLKNLKQLNTLDIDSTQINNVSALNNSESLKVLHANYTSINTILPLQKLIHLEKIYVDHTGINREAANAFIAVNSKSQIIFDSDNLRSWWDALIPEWQEAFSKAAHVGVSPSNEEMAKVSHLDSINIGGNIRVNNLEPLRKLQNLKVLIANRSGIRDLSPLQELKEIQYLDISETEVSDISIISRLPKLKVFRADKSKIENMETLTLRGLQQFYADNTVVHDISARVFLEKNPKCLLVYKTIHLNRWWNSLPENWKEVFRIEMNKDTTSTRENLHKLVEEESIHFKDAQVSDLNALSEFVRLKELHFSGTAISTIPPLENIKSLTSLHATNSPIQQIESLSLFTLLEDLDISNTPVEDLKVLGNLSHLKKLNCAGTQIKRLDVLEKFEHLESLDCSNTNVSKLDPLDNLQLKTLKCYNTKVSNRNIESFKVKHPECNVVYYR